MSKILITYCDQGVAEIHKRNFQKEGLETVVVPDEKDVLDVVEKEKIDIVLIGMNMNGFEIAKKIRKNNQGIKIYIIGVGDSLILKENQEKAIESGANDFIDVVHVAPDKTCDIIMGRIVNEEQSN